MANLALCDNNYFCVMRILKQFPHNRIITVVVVVVVVVDLHMMVSEPEKVIFAYLIFTLIEYSY